MWHTVFYCMTLYVLLCPYKPLLGHTQTHTSLCTKVLVLTVVLICQTLALHTMIMQTQNTHTPYWILVIYRSNKLTLFQVILKHFLCLNLHWQCTDKPLWLRLWETWLLCAKHDHNWPNTDQLIEDGPKLTKNWSKLTWKLTQTN